MNEEAGFIAALLAEPDDVTTLLVYADWLYERSDPRAEYLRLLTTEEPNEIRLSELRGFLDPEWVRLIDTRQFRIGVWVWWRTGWKSIGKEWGIVVELSTDRRFAHVRNESGMQSIPITDLQLSKRQGQNIW